MTNKKVIILGGGVAGMSAAHELSDRGYEVEVYERNPVYVGGKARSVDYFGDPSGPYKIPLPGEHGFRFFPGFYKHITDTMKRIPFTTAKGKRESVYDNLTPTSRIMIARYGLSPIVTIASFPKNAEDIRLIIKDLHGTDTGLSPESEKFFAERIWQLATSCTNRRNNDYERLSWWQYLEADKYGEPYISLLVEGLTRTLVAAQANTASTKTGGNVFLQLLFCMIDPSVNTDRVLDGPTNERWLYAWSDYLKSKGVKYFQGYEALEVKMNSEEIKLNPNASEKIISAKIKKPDGTIMDVTGDHYILAMPVERAAPLITKEIIAADETLQYIIDLAPKVNWMNGIQFYLNQDVVINKGHVIYSNSEWALTSISQVQFWDDYDITSKGNGDVKGLLSVDISDWQQAGKFTTTKCADDCTKEEVMLEVWAQLKNSLNVNDTVVLSDDMRVDWFLDRDIEISSTLTKENPIYLTNREPLLVNMVNTWDLRPDASNDIDNLFFAADYVRTFTDRATMEGANEAARRAVNCILDKDENEAPECQVWPLEEPAFFNPLKWYDEKRWDKGLPWTMHIPLWLKAFMMIWTVWCFITSIFQFVFNKIINLSTDENKRRTWFILGSMALAIGCLALAMLKFHGWQSGAWWGFGFTGLYILYAIIFKDALLGRFILFGLAAGITELLPDNWLVNHTHTLFYPPNEPMLYASPAYMPFSWTVVLLQVGYLGFLINKKYNVWIASLGVGILGCMIIPLYEYMAINAGWWYYESAPMWGMVPIYIFVAEGLLMISIPDLYDRCEKISLKWIPVLGIIQGLVMWLACIIAYYLVG